MINSVCGTITGKTSEQVYVDTGGIEWAIQATRSALDRLPPPGEQGKVHVYLHHRENLMQLYGFCDTTERDIFMELLKVSGLGPRLAIRVLSGMSVTEFCRAVNAQDIASLSRVPGLGRKTAERIILALRGKLPEPEGDQPEDSGVAADLVSALGGMGFDRGAAARAVRGALEELRERGLDRTELEEQALRLALTRVGDE